MRLFFHMRNIKQLLDEVENLSWFVCGERIDYLPKPKAETIIILRDTESQFLFVGHMMGLEPMRKK